MAVPSAASPPVVQAVATSIWMVPLSICRMTTPTAAPATSMRRRLPMLSRHSDPHSSLSIFSSPPPTSSTCDLRPVLLQRSFGVCTVFIHFKTLTGQKIWATSVFWSSWVSFLYQTTLQGKSTTLFSRHASSHGESLLPYSVLLWQAASPGSSASHVSSQHYDPTPPSHQAWSYRLSLFRKYASVQTAFSTFETACVI